MKLPILDWPGGGYIEPRHRAGPPYSSPGTAHSPCRHGWSARRTVGRIGRRLLVLGAERRRADGLHVHVLLLGRVLGHDRRSAVVLRWLVHVGAAGPVDLR